MAQHKFQPMMSSPNTPTYIRPGVVDGSAGIMANTVANLIPGAIQGYEGYQLMQVRKEQDKNIAALESSWQADKDEAEASASIAGQTSAIENVWDSFDAGVEPMGAVNLMEKEIQSQVKKLEAAKAQGRLSDAEFLARNTKIVREAINRHPWMEAEIYSAANRHLAAMGITDALTERAKAAKSLSDANEQTMKFYRQAFKDANMLHKFDQSAGEAAWQAQLSEYGERKTRLDTVNDYLNTNKAMSALELQQALNGGEAYKFHDLETEDFQDTLVRNLENAQTPQEYDNAIASARLQKETRLRQYRTKLGSAAVTDEGKSFLAQVEKDYDSIVDTLVEAGNGKQGAERLKNRLEIVKATQGLEVREQFNPELIDISTKILTAFGDSVQKQLRTLGLPTLNTAVKNVLQMIDPKNGGEKAQGAAVERGVPQAVVRGILDHNKGWDNRDTQVMLTQIVGSTNDAVTKGLVSEKAGNTAINGILKSVAQNAYKIQGQPVNPEFARQVGVAVDKSMGTTVTNLMTAINEVMDNPANAGAKPPELDILPDGSFVIRTGDATADDKFNKYFSALVNNALDSFAAANGMSREKAAPKFYQKYMRNYVPYEDLKVQQDGELNIQTTREAEAALKAGRITQQEYDAIIKEGFK